MIAKKAAQKDDLLKYESVLSPVFIPNSTYEIYLAFAHCFQKCKRQKSYFFHMISNYAIEFFSPTFEEDSKWQPKNAEHQIPRRPISGASM